MFVLSKKIELNMVEERVVTSRFSRDTTTTYCGQKSTSQPCSGGTRVFVYALVHVMCLCVYMSIICQRCMLYDDMYSHDNSLMKFLLKTFLNGDGDLMHPI
jgi:hypothetical protein